MQFGAVSHTNKALREREASEHTPNHTLTQARTTNIYTNTINHTLTHIEARGRMMRINTRAPTHEHAQAPTKHARMRIQAHAHSHKCAQANSHRTERCAVQRKALLTGERLINALRRPLD